MSNAKHAPRVLILCPGAFLRRLWLKALTGTTNSPGEKLLGDAIPLVSLAEGVILAGPAFGAPAAAYVTEHHVKRGVSTVVLLGTAGALVDERSPMEIGDLIFPRGSLGRGEAWSRHDPSPAQAELESMARRVLPGTNAHEGGVWTVDVPLETIPEGEARSAARGAIAVEMEYAAVSQAVKRHSAELLAVFAVSDLVGVTHETGFSSERLRQSLGGLVEAGAEYLRNREGSQTLPEPRPLTTQ